MGYQNFFIRDMTGGKGFIGMAAATIGGASPLLSAIFAYVFGFADAVTNYSKLMITDAQFLAGDAIYDYGCPDFYYGNYKEPGRRSGE